MAKHSSIHRTASGSVSLVETWGHGVQASSDYHIAPWPCFITSDDGDGHYSAWRITGKMRDAAKVVGRLELGDRRDSPDVAVFHNRHVSIERAPEGFWINVMDDDGDLIETKAADPALFPAVVAS